MIKHFTDKNNLEHIRVKVTGKERAFAYGFYNCETWLDADYYVSGNARDQVRTGAFWYNGNNVPGLVNDGTICVAGHNVITFSEAGATNQQSLITDSAFVPSENTIAVVFKSSAWNTTQNTLLSNSSSIGGNSFGALRQIYAGYGSGASGKLGIYSNAAGTISTILNTGLNKDTWYILVFNRSNFIVNGTQYSTTKRILMNYTAIGSNVANTTLRGRVAELISFDSQFTELECMALCENIRQKYLVY